ncbi:hypothetical protein Gogos_021093 [Gossypium gossypioides]|uniref:PRA1 family protein n=1 Tax=Gossypium gossypioides TaxID=34282 RepID=A0A7J9D6C2_GOSGO|nr:hypothetical protein [Gossypium gossypioides]
MLPVSVSTLEPNADSKPLITAQTLLTRLSTYLRLALSYCRPWTDFIDRTAFAKPASFSDATSRLRKNFSYFRANYLTILTAVLAFSLITHPFSLIILLSLIALGFSSTHCAPRNCRCVGSLLISGIMMGIAIVCAHGAFRTSEDLFLDEQEPFGLGLFSFVSAAASSAAANAAAPVIVSRV